MPIFPATTEQALAPGRFAAAQGCDFPAMPGLLSASPDDLRTAPLAGAATPS